MNTTLQSEQILYGLFELDPAGTVLYSRMETEGEARAARGADISGLNFYEQVASFENVEEFRQRVTQFTRGTSPADNFTFDCLYEGRALSIKVLLARMLERLEQNRAKSVLVHIRKNA